MNSLSTSTMGWIQEAKEAQARAALAGGNHSFFNYLIIANLKWYIRSYLVTLNLLDEDYTNEEDADPAAASAKKKTSDKTNKKLQEELMETEVSLWII